MSSYEEIEYECIQGVKGKQHYIAGRKYKLSRVTMEAIGREFFRPAGQVDQRAVIATESAQAAQQRIEDEANARHREARRQMALKEAQGQEMLAKQQAERAEMLRAQAAEMAEAARLQKELIPGPVPPPPVVPPETPSESSRERKDAARPRAERLKDA